MANFFKLNFEWNDTYPRHKGKVTTSDIIFWQKKICHPRDVMFTVASRIKFEYLDDVETFNPAYNRSDTFKGGSVHVYTYTNKNYLAGIAALHTKVVGRLRLVKADWSICR